MGRGLAAARPIHSTGAPIESSTSSIATAFRRGYFRCRPRRPIRKIAWRTPAAASLLPVPGRDIMVQAGIREAFRCSTSPTRRTRSRSPFSTAAPIDAKTLITGGYWSTYWYNGAIYASEIARGLDCSG